MAPVSLWGILGDRKPTLMLKIEGNQDISMGTVYQKHVHPGTTVWERSPYRPQCKCVRGGCFGGKSSFSPFSAMACHSHKIQAPPGRLKTQINHLFFMPVCWEALLGWLNTGLEVTAGVTLSVCWCMHICWGMCVSGLAHPPPVFPGSLPHRPMQTSWKPAGSVPPARAHTPLPLFPPLAQGAHTALGSMDPKPLSQASWLACPPAWWVVGGGDTGGMGGKADRFPAAAGAG